MRCTLLIAAALAFWTSGSMALPQKASKAEDDLIAQDGCSNIGFVVVSNGSIPDLDLPDLTGWTGKLWKNYAEEWGIEVISDNTPDFFPLTDGVASSERGSMVFRDFQNRQGIEFFAPTFVTEVEAKDHQFLLTIGPNGILGVDYDGDRGSTTFYLCQVSDGKWELDWLTNAENDQGQIDLPLCRTAVIAAQCVAG